jgi:hypothetical protein
MMRLLNSFEAKQSIMSKIMKYKDSDKLDNKISLDYLNKKFNENLLYEKRKISLCKRDKEKIINLDSDSFIENKNALYLNKSEENLDETLIEIEKDKEIKESFLDLNVEQERKNSSVSNFSLNYLKNNPFSIKISDLFCFIFCCKSIKKKKKIFVNAEKRFNNNIDLVTFMKKMQEIEILKFLLLDRDTLRLMNFISKPCISYTNKEIEDEEYKEFFEIYDNNIEMTHDNIDKIKESYDKIINKEKISFTEKRILKLFGLHIEEILN